MSKYQASKKNQMLRDIRDFHEKFGLEYNGRPRGLPPDLAEFRRRFLLEELDEYRKETHRLEYYLLMLLANAGTLTVEDKAEFTKQVIESMANGLDGLVDLVYVAIGTAYLHGFDFEEAWRRVHEANMKKIRVENVSDSKRGSTFDVVKPEGWVAPDLTDLIKDHAHE